MNVHQSLAEFVEKYCSIHSTSKRTTEFDADWPSPCINRSNCKSGDIVNWSPVEQAPKQLFDNLEEGLDLLIHPDIKAFYTSFWSDNLAAFTSQGPCELIQPWNEHDFARLQENLIGHVLMKRRLKQPITLFIGLSENEEFIISVDNNTGEVLLEQVGKLPTKVLAGNLSQFINGLSVEQI